MKKYLQHISADTVKKYVGRLLPVLVLVAGVNIVWAMNSAKSGAVHKEELPAPTSLYVEKVAQEDVRLIIQAEGVVNPKTEITLVAQVSGRILSVSPFFTEGGIVSSGATVIEIEDADYRLSIIRAKARVIEAEVSLQQSLAEADVAQSQLNGEQHTPLARRIPQIAEAKAKLNAAKAEFEQAQINLSHTKVLLPFDGIVTTKLVDVGQFVSVGTTLGNVFSTATAEVQLSLSDSQLAALGLPIGFVATENNAPQINLYAVVGGQTRQWQGQLVRLDSVVDSQTRLLTAYAEIQEPYGKAASIAGGMPLAMGLYVNVDIQGRQLSDAYVIPRDALRTNNQVYVIENGRLDIRKVDVIHQSPLRVVLSGGVAKDESVVVSPLKIPVEGMSVKAFTKTPSQEFGIAATGHRIL